MSGAHSSSSSIVRNGGGGRGREEEEIKNGDDKKNRQGPSCSTEKKRKEDSKEGEAEAGASKKTKSNESGSPPPAPLNGFERGLTPAIIQGAGIRNDELFFLVKWRENGEEEFIPARVVNARCPQLVIQFYEARVQFHRPAGPAVAA